MLFSNERGRRALDLRESIRLQVYAEPTMRTGRWLSLPENFPLGTFRWKAQRMALVLENLSSCRKVLKLSQERLTIKIFRPLRRSVKGAAFAIRHLLEKVDENFMIRKREHKSANLYQTNNANCVQAQPEEVIQMLYLPAEVSFIETVRYALGTQPPLPLPDSLTVPAQSAIEELLRSCLPQYHYRILPISELPDTLLRGQDIRRHLDGCERCVLFAATLGTQADRLLRRAQITDMNRALWLDAAASATIEAVCDAAQSAISAQLHCGLTARFSCGYGDFPLTAQGAILELLDAPRKIGLTLGQSGMMIPLKSVTALMGILPAGAVFDGQALLCTRCRLYQNGCDGTRCRPSLQ